MLGRLQMLRERAKSRHRPIGRSVLFRTGTELIARSRYAASCVEAMRHHGIARLRERKRAPARSQEARLRVIMQSAYALFARRAAAALRVATRGRALWKLRNLRTCPQSLQTPRLFAPLECSITQ